MVAELGMSSKDTDAETAKLLKHKTVAKFTTIDRCDGPATVGLGQQ